MLSNSIYCDTYIRNNFRLVHWNRERGCKCQHKNVVDWCGCSPLVYRNADRTILNVRLITGSIRYISTCTFQETIDRPLFFARKFDPTIDETILDWLDEKLSRRDLSTGQIVLRLRPSLIPPNSSRSLLPAEYPSCHGWFWSTEFSLEVIGCLRADNVDRLSRSASALFGRWYTAVGTDPFDLSDEHLSRLFLWLSIQRSGAVGGVDQSAVQRCQAFERGEALRSKKICRSAVSRKLLGLDRCGVR